MKKLRIICAALLAAAALLSAILCGCGEGFNSVIALDDAGSDNTEDLAKPTAEQTAEATAEPTAEPTSEPTAEPTAEPTPEPAPQYRTAESFTAIMEDIIERTGYDSLPDAEKEYCIGDTGVLLGKRILAFTYPIKNGSNIEPGIAVWIETESGEIRCLMDEKYEAEYVSGKPSLYGNSFIIRNMGDYLQLELYLSGDYERSAQRIHVGSLSRYFIMEDELSADDELYQESDNGGAGGSWNSSYYVNGSEVSEEDYFALNREHMKTVKSKDILRAVIGEDYETGDYTGKFYDELLRIVDQEESASVQNPPETHYSYEEFLSAKGYSEFLKDGAVSGKAQSYCIIDIDKNGVDEMVIIGETTMGFGDAWVFTIDKASNSVAYCGSVYFYSAVYYSPKAKALFCSELRPQAYGGQDEFYQIKGSSLEYIYSLGYANKGQWGDVDYYYKSTDCGSTVSRINESSYNEYYSNAKPLETSPIP